MERAGGRGLGVVPEEGPVSWQVPRGGWVGDPGAVPGQVLSSKALWAAPLDQALPLGKAGAGLGAALLG